MASSHRIRSSRARAGSIVVVVAVVEDDVTVGSDMMGSRGGRAFEGERGRGGEEGGGEVDDENIRCR